jgi:hypothetical protein
MTSEAGGMFFHFNPKLLVSMIRLVLKTYRARIMQSIKALKKISDMDF